MEIDEINELLKIVTRFEVIDHTYSILKGGGRVLVSHNKKIELSIQDEGRTLKVFLSSKENT